MELSLLRTTVCLTAAGIVPVADCCSTSCRRHHQALLVAAITIVLPSFPLPYLIMNDGWLLLASDAACAVFHEHGSKVCAEFTCITIITVSSQDVGVTQYAMSTCNSNTGPSSYASVQVFDTFSECEESDQPIIDTIQLAF